MKQIKVLIVLVFASLVFHNILIGQSINTYTDGLKNCKELRKKKKVENKTEFVYVGTECMEGYLLPDFKLKTINGELITNESLKGKLTIINFWFISCQPCLSEIPGFNKIVKEYGEDKINFIAIGKESKEDIIDFLKTNKWNFKHIGVPATYMFDKLHIQWGFPTTFIADKNGVIIKAWSGGAPGDTAVSELLKNVRPTLDKYLNK